MAIDRTCALFAFHLLNEELRNAGDLSMRPIDTTLLAIASAREVLQPVQLQKSLFLFAAKVPKDVLPADSRYQFKPYDYGPFSAEIYSDAETLEADGLVEIMKPPVTRYRQYSVTPQGALVAQQIRERENPSVVEYLSSLVAYTQSLGFNQLVASVYDEYPEMKVNSVFRGAA